MTGKQLKEWALTLHDDAIIEVNRYSWDALDADKIRATWISTPKRTMDDVCNAEQVAL